MQKRSKPLVAKLIFDQLLTTRKLVGMIKVAAFISRRSDESNMIPDVKVSGLKVSGFNVSGFNVSGFNVSATKRFRLGGILRCRLNRIGQRTAAKRVVHGLAEDGQSHSGTFWEPIAKRCRHLFFDRSIATRSNP